MSSLPAHVLVVEDEPKLARLLCDYLRAAGYQATTVDDGAQVLEAMRIHPPDLVLLDVMLPGRSGLELCRDIRAASTVPIIMVSARVEEIDRLLGLELGADDYICKPFSPREVVARVKAVLRRAEAAGAPAVAGEAAVLDLDEGGFRVRAGGRQQQLTAVEFHLFQALYRTPGRIFSRSQLMDRIYDDRRVVSDRTIDSHVKKLRRKLEAVLPGEDLVQSVYGAGYRYQPPEPPPED